LANFPHSVYQDVAASVLLHADGPGADLLTASPVSEVAQTSAAPTAQGADAPISLDDRIRDLEASLIGWALKVSHGNKSRAAELLQIKRSTLGDRINRCGLGGAHTRAEDVHDPSSMASSS